MYTNATMKKKIIPHFIVLEGIDGSGTTTQIQRLSNTLSQNKIPHRCDAEPTASVVGQRLRQLLKSGDGENPLFNTTMSALFSLDRALHLFGEEGIIETVQQGKWLLCDRYLFSTLAYQGVLGNEGEIREMNDGFALPEFVFFLDITPEKALERIQQRGTQKEIYENRQFLQKVRENYLKIFRENQESEMKIFILDATRSPQEIQGEIACALGLSTI